MTAPLSGRYEGRPRDTPAVEVHSSVRTRALPTLAVAVVLTVLVAIITPGPAGGLLAVIVGVGTLAVGAAATYRAVTADQDGLLVRRRMTHDLIGWDRVHALWVTPAGFRRGWYRFARINAKIGSSAASAEPRVLVIGTGDLSEALARIRSVIPSEDLHRLRSRR